MPRKDLFIFHTQYQSDNKHKLSMYIKTIQFH